MAEAKPISLVILDEEQDSNTQVQVLRKNRDQFFLSLREAVESCAAFATRKHDYSSQISDLLDLLSKWVEERRDRIKSAYCTVRPGGNIFFLVVQKAIAFDQELSSQLTQLDIDVANSETYALIDFDVLAIPAVSRKSADAFLASGKVYTHA
jgi:hypothetical protein